MRRTAFVILIIIAFSGCDAPDIANAKSIVAGKMKDPESARFKGVHSEGEYVCGLINAKNSFGAYSGFQRFIVDTGSNTVELDRGELAQRFSMKFATRCPQSSLEDFENSG